MTTVTVRIPTPLRGFTDGAERLDGQGGTVGEVIQFLGRRHEGLGERILNPDGSVRTFVNLFLDGRDIRTLEGLDTRVADGQSLAIVPAVAGGRP